MIIILGIILCYIYNTSCRSVAQPGSASGLGPEGREFESLHSDHFSQVYGSSNYLELAKTFLACSLVICDKHIHCFKVIRLQVALTLAT